jgi:DUF4097 and DUF4098 domain-containing protein YvlB
MTRHRSSLSFAALGALAALGLSAADAPLAAQRDDDYRARVDTSFAFEPNGRVTLSIVSGEIIVRTGRPGEIRVLASIERGRLETTFSRLTVSVEARSVRNRMGSARFEVTVPPGTRVVANAVSGDVDVRGTGAEVSVNTVSGDLTVHDAARRLEASTVSGDLALARIMGDVRIESVSGDVVADEVRGDLGFETVSGEIDLRRSRLTGIRMNSVSGDLRYDGPISAGGTYRFESHSGNVEFGLAANAGAVLSLQTYGGRISSDFPLTLQPNQATGRSRRMEFTIGSGGTRITAETFSGNITIRRQSASDNNPE